jgi:peroxiredoxin
LTLVSLAALVGAGVMLVPQMSPGPRAPAGSRPLLSDPATGSPATAASFDTAMKALDLVRLSGPTAAADFTVRRLGGGSFRLSEQRGKTVLVNFWATWCPPCLAEMPAMERLWRRHRHGGFVVVAVSVDADAATVPRFIEDRGVSFPVALDPEMKVANTYGVRALPASFFIDRRGRLTALALGPRDWDARAAQVLVEALETQ